MSDTVKLVIEIPKGVVEYIKNNDCLAVGYLDEVAKAIKNGTPLEGITTKIANMPAVEYETYKFRTRMLDILDNIGTAESQEPADDVDFLSLSLEDLIDCS